jgi:hypothetical protein
MNAKKSLSIYKLSALAVSLFALASCGGGGGGDAGGGLTNNTEAVDITGQVFLDAPLSGANIAVKCANGTSGAAQTVDNGSYKVVVRGPQFPCLLRASGGASAGRTNSDNIYSVALQATGGIVSNITSLSLRTAVSNMDAEFDTGLIAKYDRQYLDQRIIELDSRLSMKGYLKVLSNFSSTSSFEKALIQDFSKSLYFSAKNRSDFMNSVALVPGAQRWTYGAFYDAYQHSVSNLSDLYWAKSYAVFKNGELVDWIVYPKPTSEYSSSGNPELYNLIVPEIEFGSGGVLNGWVEETYPSPSAEARLFTNGNPSDAYKFTYSVISRAWFN